MFEPSSRRLTHLAYVAGATAAVLVGILIFHQWTAAKWETSVRQILAASAERSQFATDYLTLLRDLETGQRGLLVTDDRTYLQPFDMALRALPTKSKEVETTFAPEDRERSTALALVEVGNSRAARAVAILKAYNLGQRDRAKTMVAEGTGKRLMDRARGLSERIVRSEALLARAYQARSSADRSATQRTTYLLEAAILIVLGVLVMAQSRILASLRRSSVTQRDMATRQAAIFDSATDGMMILDAVGRVENINPAMQTLFGYSRADLIGKSNLVLFKEPPSSETSQAYLRSLAGGKDVEARQMFEGLRADGTTLEAEVVTAPVVLADGLRFLAVARDATERRQIERMKEEFVATVSHELRTPLTSIAGSLGLLLGGVAGTLDEKAMRLLQIAKNSSDRLIRLINEMLDIEKISSGKISFDLKPVDLVELINSCVSQIQSFADERSIAIQVERDRPKITVIADQDRLNQVLTNLLSNAIKFSPSGGTVEVLVSESHDRRALISVRDHGAGMSREFQGRIFQKFAQEDSTDSRQKGGTGLGLSIAKEIVERLGGSISFVSEEGEGTTFTFDLPLAERHRLDGTAQHIGRIDDTGDLQILHIDDDADTLRLVASAFHGRAQVHSSPSLKEGIAAIDRYDFDVIILDLAMPDGDGMELVDHLEEASSPKTPVILYTALDASAPPDARIFARLTKSKATLDQLIAVVEKATAEAV